jgi:hypothetical protein
MDHRSQGRAPMRLQSVMTLVNRQQKRGARSPDCAERCRAAGTSKRQQDSLRRYDKRRKTPTRYDQKRLRSRPPMSRAMLAHDVELVPSQLKDKFGARSRQDHGPRYLRYRRSHHRSAAQTRWTKLHSLPEKVVLAVGAPISPRRLATLFQPYPNRANSQP